ncbi:phosphohistidine phosphatase SixA [Spirulina major]|uniref:phosphohistidine phosphatase SixA n=1 Tax=Spirulina major TaxID=270636 RepID=UPI0009355FF8|nr:phosphohistidine phosphatase SixA [Spirulina major]
MRLYLIRHGIAADRARYSQDAERPLTEKGRKKTQQVAQRLVQLGITVDVLLSSPLVRAHQTAEIFQQAGLAPSVDLFPPLAPEGDLNLWVNWYTVQSLNAIALVGHQPDLGQWAEQLVWGKSSDRLTVKKAGIIGLRLNPTGNPIGNAELVLLTSPKWLL